MSVVALGLQNGPGRRASLGWDEMNFLSLILVPTGAVFNIEHERGKSMEEVEFLFKWKLM